MNRSDVVAFVALGILLFGWIYILAREITDRLPRWRHCRRCRIWWHASNRNVTFVNPPDQLSLPGRCPICDFNKRNGL